MIDPSNLSPDYLRPRLRGAREVLEAEGLTSKRLARTAQRLGRARRALEEIAERAFEESLKDKNEHRLVFDLPALRRQPEEISLRVVSKAIDQLLKTFFIEIFKKFRSLLFIEPAR